MYLESDLFKSCSDLFPSGLMIRQYGASRKFVKFNFNSLFGPKSEVLISVQAESAGDPW